ncbi:hypothetical protein [Roseomonas marmotae]|uniref:Uncharacterized protein n=1 Tax=Roseomonas marmotae TaxID=2768161 RepID=A0ABS3K9R6_9PROT|nr:hypothetical protein [Roseomonas marmotae]MBO1074219.1 hypothetical protein [Roseomonas marmotae]QTI78985.1 hypothetical protein IAI58_15300 [Roseomonas marmotae]
MKDEQPVMGFAWYEASSFDQLRERMPDMSDSYDDWREGAGRDVQHHERQGYRVIRITIRPAEFFAWCHSRGVRMPGVRERRQFAADGARKVVRAERDASRRRFSFF